MRWRCPCIIGYPLEITAYNKQIGLLLLVWLHDIFFGLMRYMDWGILLSKPRKNLVKKAPHTGDNSIRIVELR
jgi:hypothetical protein